MSKQTYVVVPGVEAINGKAVPASREMVLTDREALFDLSLGRIERKAKSTGKGTGRKTQPEPDGPDGPMLPGAGEA